MAEDAKHVEESKDPSPVSAPAGVVMMQDEADLDDYASGEEDDYESSSSIESDLDEKLRKLRNCVTNVQIQREAQQKELRKSFNAKYGKAIDQLIDQLCYTGTREQKEHDEYLSKLKR